METLVPMKYAHSHSEKMGKLAAYLWDVSKTVEIIPFKAATTEMFAPLTLSQATDLAPIHEFLLPNVLKVLLLAMNFQEKNVATFNQTVMMEIPIPWICV